MRCDYESYRDLLAGCSSVIAPRWHSAFPVVCRRGLRCRKITTIFTQTKRNSFYTHVRRWEKRNAVPRIVQSFNASLLSFTPPNSSPTPVSFTHTQKLFNLLCPMFWQIAEEISPFFLLTLFTLFLLLLSYSVSIYFVFAVTCLFLLFLQEKETQISFYSK